MYKDKLDEIMYSVNNKAISTKILQRMDKIRNETDEGQARRFVWELVQNAKDVARDDIPLKIRMTYDRDKFVFAHNGKSFKMKNLLSLINQVSSKNPEEGTTGKYGTGFFTTHQLSEKVVARGVLEDFGYEPKRFEVLLDRSGRTDEDIIAAVDRAMDSVRTVDDNSIADFSPDDLNTEFEYALTSDYSRNVAEIGINDAHCNLFYCMAFVPSVHEIELVDNTKGIHTVYTRGGFTDEGNGIGRLEILENGQKHEILISSDGEVQTAIEVSSGAVLALSEKTSRLFCDFPLIDNVLFPFPAVVNSSAFRVNEPRSCITLTDNPNSSDSELNKRLMKQAADMYADLLKYMESKEIKAMYNAIIMPPVFKRSDLSDTWIKENIVKSIEKAVLERKILPGDDGTFAAASVKLCLPKPESDELIEELNQIIRNIKEYSVIGENIREWCAALESINCGGFKFLSIKDILNMVDGNYQKVCTMSDEPENWLRELFDCAVKVDSLKNEIYSGKYSVIPTQSSMLKPITEVFVEETEIDDYFKDICDKIDSYVSRSYALYIRQKLISKNFDISGISGLTAFDVGKISSLIRRGTKVDYINQYYEPQNVVRSVIASCADERAYKTYRYLIPDIPERYQPKLKLNDDVWDNSHSYLTGLFEEKICALAKYSNGFEQLKSSYGGEDNAVDAINCFHELWEKYCQPSNYAAPILVEQTDGSISLKNLAPHSSDYVINAGIDDKLLDIYRRIVTFENSGAAVIDKRIVVGKSMYVGSMDEFRASSLIGNKVTQELKEGSIFTKPKEFQAACSLLMRWINSNEEKAKSLFPAYASTEDRMQLMTPGQAAEMSDQLDEFNDLMEENGCTSIGELKEKLKRLQSEENAADTASSVDYVGMYGDFGFDPEKNNLDETFEKIGERGELLAVELLKKQYGEDAVTLCNTDEKKQQGYDIVVNAGDRTLFYEVKTHTETSIYRNMLKFTRSQGMLLQNSNYRVLLIVINRQWDLSESVEFDNVFDGFSLGNFTRSDGYNIVVA